MTRHRFEDGAAAVEFALVVPLLLFVLFAIIDLGWIFNQQLAVTAAAREGARYYAVNYDEAGAKATAEARAANLVSGPVSFAYESVCTGGQDEDLTMVVSTPMTDLTGWVVALSGGATLDGKGTMRCNG